MRAIPRIVQNYVTPDGRELFEQWLQGLSDTKVRGRIKARIDRLEDGNFGDSKSLGKGLWELRLDFNAGYRVYYGKAKKIVVILLCGGDKHTQRKDIKKAEEYWAEFKSRK